MNNFGKTTLPNLASSTGGQEIVEAAMVIPLLFMVMLAIFWFGQAFEIYGTVTHAAREGARAAIAPNCATCTPNPSTTNVITAVNNALTAAHLNPNQVQAPVQVPGLCACGSTTTACSGAGVVQCAPNVMTSNVCVQPNVQLATTSQGGAGTCGTSVSFRYQYPFSFKIPCWPQPCTSLDLQNLTIPAQAQMRLESQ